MMPVLLAYYVAWGVHGEKIRKSIVQSLMQQSTQFSSTPLSAQGSYGDEDQACSSRVHFTKGTPVYVLCVYCFLLLFSVCSVLGELQNE